MVTKTRFLIIIFCLFFLCGSSFAQMTGRQIMQKQKDLHESKNEYVEQEMRLIDKSGKEEVRKVKNYMKEVKMDENRSLVVFLSPPDVRGTAQ